MLNEMYFSVNLHDAVEIILFKVFQFFFFCIFVYLKIILDVILGDLI